MRPSVYLRSLLASLGGEGGLVDAGAVTLRAKPKQRRNSTATIPHRFESFIDREPEAETSLPDNKLSDMLTERLQELVSSRVSSEDSVMRPSSSVEALVSSESFVQPVRDPDAGPMREFTPYISKVLSRTGCCSRRESSALISRGHVSVNGQTITDSKFVCSPRDAVSVVGVSGTLRFSPPRLWVYHKPRNVSSSLYDPQGRKVLMAHAATLGFDHIVPVCPLPFSQHGLMLLTNDGALGSYIESPSTQLQHVYRLRVSPSLSPLLAQRLTEGGVDVDGVSHKGYEFTVDPRRSERYVKLRVRGEELPVSDVMKSLGRVVQRGGRVSLGPFRLDGLGLGQTKEVVIPPSYFSQIGDSWRPFIERDWPFFRRRRIRALRSLCQFRVLSQKEMEELDSLVSEETLSAGEVVQKSRNEFAERLSARPLVDVPLH